MHVATAAMKILVLALLVQIATAVPLSPAGRYGDSLRGPAQPCDKAHCNLPTCRCAGTDIPGGLSPDKTPQIVMFSFDDSLRVQDFDTYYSKAFPNRKNPNGCEIGLTFFVSGNDTDYSLVEDLYYSHNYEMADHSVDHREPTTWWKNASKDEYTHEIMDQKSILEKWGNVPADSIRGFRGPFLVTSETEISVLHDNKFTYEATMGTQTNYWPFTLDYKSPICNSPSTCPNNSYPGLWLVPNIDYKQSNGFPCPMLDACTAPQSEKEWLDFFMENFNLHYNDNRSPFGVYSHSAWFYYGPQRLAALSTFLDKLATMKDVYIVTHSQMLDWVQNPTPLDKIGDFAPWKCPPRPKPRCSYKSPSCQKYYGEFSMKSCTTPCPPRFPHYGDPDGN